MLYFFPVSITKNLKGNKNIYTVRLHKNASAILNAV